MENQIKERPILFSAPMVRAILGGRKTVTRRICKPQPSAHAHTRSANGAPMASWWETGKDIIRCPHGGPGDLLWVRETWYCDHFEVMCGPYLKPDDLNASEAIDDGTLVYAADGLTPYEADQPIWKPSIHMPRWASRILLEITDVRVERLQDITEKQAETEGVQCDSDDWLDYLMPSTQCCVSARDSFRSLWESINGSNSWSANPWVWCVSFRRVEQ